MFNQQNNVEKYSGHNIPQGLTFRSIFIYRLEVLSYISSGTMHVWIRANILTFLALIIKVLESTVTEVVLVATNFLLLCTNLPDKFMFKSSIAKHHGKWSKTVARVMLTPLELHSSAEGLHASQNILCYTLSCQICSDKFLQH